MIAPVLLPAAMRLAVPWKDGGGITRTIASEPEDADLATFDWRLSIAEVSAIGPFSCFEGIDRSLAVLEGTLSLDVSGEPYSVSLADGPVTFAGDVPILGRPINGSVIDLNLMVRRGRATGRLAALTPEFVPGHAASTLILIFTTPGALTHYDGRVVVDRFDAIRLDPASCPAITVCADGPVVVAEIAFVA